MDDELSKIPDLSEARKGILKNPEELEYGLRAMVRILGRRKGAVGGYFFSGFVVKFADELNSNKEVKHEETYLDYEKLKIFILLPKPAEGENREMIRHQFTMDYTMGADDLKTRAALIAFQGLDEKAKKMVIEKEKEFEKNKNTSKD